MHKLDRTLFLLALLPFIVVSTSLIFFHSMLGAFGTYHLLVCLFLPILYLKSHPSKVKLSHILGLAGERSKSTFTGLILGIISFGIIVLFFTVFQKTLLDKEHISSLLTSWGYNKNNFIFLAVYFVFFNAIVEEIFWRGFLYGQYKKVIGKRTASLWIAFCFIQYHFATIWLLFSLQSALLFTLILFLVNLVWNYYCVRFDNIYTSIVWHLFADLAIMWVYFFYVYS